MRDKDYQRMLNSKRWKELRAWKLNTNPLCERCEAEGYVRAAVDVHHIRPVCGSILEMEALCFNPANLQSLCVPCHIQPHKEMGKTTRKNVDERKKQRLDRWIERVSERKK